MQAPLPTSAEFELRRQRRRTARSVFLGLALGILVVGVALLVLGFAPGLVGLRAGLLGWRYAGGFFGLLLVFWAATMLVRIAFWSSRRGAFGPGGPGRARFDPAVQAARQRYARGEITREQFQQIVTDLRRPPGPPP